MSRVVKFASKLKELRLHLCQKSESSKGVRDFLNLHYAELKKGNPNSPILVRECSYIEPQLWVRYEKGKECRIPISNCTSSDILEK